MTNPILSINKLTMKFGGLVAVHNVSFNVFPNDLIGVIGPNGAGKTTLFNMITGIYTPSSGDILLNQKRINSIRVSSISQMGVARTFQNIRLFKDLTVRDNIRLAGSQLINYSVLSSIFKTSSYREEEKKLAEKSLELLKIFKLENKIDTVAKNLPYGDQRKLEMARALATNPKVLLLDEPAAGMNGQETAELSNMIEWIRDYFKIAIVLIEHDMKLVMKTCERIYVLDYGELIAQGPPDKIQNDPKVIEAYLGGQE